MSKSEMEKMHTCELYLPGDEDIAREQIKCCLLYTSPSPRDS